MYYSAEQDCCTSFECPRYNECERALRPGQAHNYYTEGYGTTWASSSGEGGTRMIYACGEKGNWRLFLEHKDMVCVTRCKNCKYGELIHSRRGKRYWCTHDVSISTEIGSSRCHPSDWYCADGIKK